MWRSLVKNPAKIREQQADQNIANILKKSEKQKEPFRWYLNFPSSSVVETFGILRKTKYLPFCTSFTLERIIQNVKEVKELKLPSITYTN